MTIQFMGVVETVMAECVCMCVHGGGVLLLFSFVKIQMLSCQHISSNAVLIMLVYVEDKHRQYIIHGKHQGL